MKVGPCLFRNNYLSSLPNIVDTCALTTSEPYSSWPTIVLLKQSKLVLHASHYTVVLASLYRTGLGRDGPFTNNQMQAILHFSRFVSIFPSAWNI